MNLLASRAFNCFNVLTNKIKAKALKQLKAMKDNKFIGKLYNHVKPTDFPVPRCYGQSKTYKPRVPISPILSYRWSPLYSRNKYIANILKALVKD